MCRLCSPRSRSGYTSTFSTLSNPQDRRTFPCRHYTCIQCPSSSLPVSDYSAINRTAAVGFTHASAASPTRIDESEETKAKAEMAKTLLLFLRPLLPLFFFFFSMVVLVFFIQILFFRILKFCVVVVKRNLSVFVIGVFFPFFSFFWF